MKLALALLSIAVVLALFVTRSRGTISGAQARRLVEDGAVLVDVRGPSEYASGHIEGARNIPIDDLEARLEELGDRATPLVLYCRSGRRSARGQRLLKDNGFTDVHNLGGMRNWD